MEKQKNNDLSILATDFSKVDDDMKYWNERRLKKGNIYHAFSEYIICLENSLEHEINPYQKNKIEQEIEMLKIEQQKYYVPTILELANYDLVQAQKNKTVEESKSTLERSNCDLIKSEDKVTLRSRRKIKHSMENKDVKVHVRSRRRLKN